MKTPRFLFAVGSSIAVIATIVAGLFIAGSPSEQRMRRADEQRAQHLSEISYAVDAFWNTNGGLPESLKELNNSQYYIDQMRDPKTQELYRYRLLIETGKYYELCATFETSTEDEAAGLAVKPRPVSGSDVPFWTHGSGWTCFAMLPRNYPKPSPM